MKKLDHIFIDDQQYTTVSKMSLRSTVREKEIKEGKRSGRVLGRDKTDATCCDV